MSCTEQPLMDDKKSVKLVYKLCFQSIEQDSSTYTIIANIDGDKVTGYHNWVPAEKGSNTGPFSGQLTKNGIIEAIKTSSGEGVTYQEPIHFKIVEDKIYDRWQVNLEKNNGAYIKPWHETTATPQIECNALK